MSSCGVSVCPVFLLNYNLDVIFFLVPNCPFYVGAILSWCQIVWVQNCPFLTLGAKLSAFNSWCQIVLQSSKRDTAATLAMFGCYLRHTKLQNI